MNLGPVSQNSSGLLAGERSAPEMAAGACAGECAEEFSAEWFDGIKDLLDDGKVNNSQK
mgnify:CR=1 FL=1